jgi:hypothetical protein
LPRDVLSGSRRSAAKKGNPTSAHLEIGQGLLLARRGQYEQEHGKPADEACVFELVPREGILIITTEGDS